MTVSQIYRICGLSLLLGAVVFVVHIVLRSWMTAGVAPLVVAGQGLWVPVNLLGVIGSVLVLLGMPAMYARVADRGGVFSLLGVALIAMAWMFFGLFLSLYAALVSPWLAAKAPSLVAGSAPLPAGIVVAFAVGLVAWFAGSVLFGIPFIRGRVGPRWVGYLLPASALWVVLGNFVIAPSGPAANLAVNLLSNLGPVLLLVVIGYLGLQMWKTTGMRAADTLPLP